MKTICFTGRRPKDLAGFKYQSYSSFLDDLTTYLDSLYQKGVRNFISGGAQGFDQLAFWSVNRLQEKYDDINNVVYVPFPGQESVWSTRSDDFFSQFKYREMLSKADNVRFISEQRPFDRWSAAKLLDDRNKAMIDDADFVVALYPYDDWKSIGKGGTCNAMRYAYNKRKIIYQIKFKLTSILTFSDVIKITPESSSRSKLFKNLI